MPPDNTPRTRALRMLMMMDATVLILLGIGLICCPAPIEKAFQFGSVSPALSFLIGLWGCVLLTLGAGYSIAAVDPFKHRLWVGVGVARGLLEALFGLWCLQREMVTWKQSGLGTLLAAFMGVAYLALYPRQTRNDEWKSPH